MFYLGDSPKKIIIPISHLVECSARFLECNIANFMLTPVEKSDGVRMVFGPLVVL